MKGRKKMEQKFCQSCGMPMSDLEMYARERDGSRNEDYCKYCYKDGAFQGDMTMEEMIEFCVPMVVQSNPGTDASEARAKMKTYFPKLKRWRNGTR